MLLRLLFVLLIALNIAVAAWLLLGDTGAHAVDPTDAGVPTLKLLAETPAKAATTPTVPAPVRTVASPAPAASIAAAPPAPEPAKPPPQRSYRCLAVGPFASQVELKAARTTLTSRTVRSRQRQEQTSESHGWRVYLPSQPTHELAVAQARRLEAKGVKDYFVVGAQGDQPHSVALGLFQNPANARKRRDEVVAAGFPARMSERTETVPVWWLDVVVADDAAADVRRAVRAPGVTTRTTGCF